MAHSGGCARVGTGNMWEISVPSAEFCYEHATALKNKAYFLNEKIYYMPSSPTTGD